MGGVKKANWIPVGDTEVATIVTALEMRRKPPLRPIPSSPLKLVRWQRPTLANYRALFARVGTPWLWFSRLVMPDAALAEIVEDPDVHVFAAVDAQQVEVGMVELDYRRAGETHLAYFGLVPELAGQGHGRWMMAETIARAWLPSTRRVWVHTCTLDHPSALGFYQAQGFTPISRAVETFPDPRLTGALPPNAAPQIPLLAR